MEKRPPEARYKTMIHAEAAGEAAAEAGDHGLVPAEGGLISMSPKRGPV